MTQSFSFRRPVLLLVFNRLDTTVKVLEELRKVRPAKVYIAADGPRPNKPGESELVREVRNATVSSIDWDCQIDTLFRDENLGCKFAVSGALSWFFENEESGIILEDDCLPSPDFFRFCDEMLDRYADDEQVMHVSGSSLADLGPQSASYFFSRYPMIWGWATWSRAWSRFSLDRPVPQTFEHILGDLTTQWQRDYWRRVLNHFYAGEIDTWDYAWVSSIWQQGGLTISPTRNLISNIGFGRNSTHTGGWRDYRGLGNRSIEPLGEIVPPASEELNDSLDEKLFMDLFWDPPAPIKAMKLIRHLALSRRP